MGNIYGIQIIRTDKSSTHKKEKYLSLWNIIWLNLK